MRALITTTITVPENLREWRKHLNDDDVIVVAGDTGGPHSAIRKFLHNLPGLNQYVAPEEQAIWRISECIGWKSIQRRNIALLEALEWSPEFITTVDTDNWPVGTEWFAPESYGDKGPIDGVPYTAPLIGGTAWYDPGNLCAPYVNHRGMPWSQKGHQCYDIITRIPAADEAIGVWASLWKGDPDIDAIERIAVNPQVEAAHSAILDLGVWAPFNSQSTTYRANLAPLMMVWPGVGRFDDIFASYLARAVMDIFGYRVYYGYPLVRQDRHEHNLLTDLKGEIFGYEHTEELVAHLREQVGERLGWRAANRHVPQEIIGQMMEITNSLKRFDWMPRQTLRTFDAWYRDLEQINK